MSGECDKCGNSMCICDEALKQPDISNSVLVDKDYLREIIAKQKQLIDKLESENCKLLKSQCDIQLDDGDEFCVRCKAYTDLQKGNEKLKSYCKTLLQTYKQECWDKEGFIFINKVEKILEEK